MFPDSYIHLGGDEVDFQCWLSNPEIKKWLDDRKEGGVEGKGGKDGGRKGGSDPQSGSAPNATTLQTYYLTKLVDIVEGLKKRYIVWQEVFDDGVELNERAIINVWKENWKEEMGKVTSSDHMAILSSCWYLNYIKYGLDWPDLYKCDPYDFGGTHAQRKLVIGGSAAMWGEYVDATNLIPYSFGRAFAVAERLWSDADVTDVKSALPRIWEQQCRYVGRGIPAQPVTRSMFCREEWNSKKRMKG